MKNILLLQTGGTIAMDPNSGGAELNPEKWGDLLHSEIPELSEIANLQIDKVFFEDSSDVNHYHWKILAETIFEKYDDYDGFVVLHGTDTMSYTASALSFTLKNLGKPVVFTGSQVPMRKLRSDARRNLVNAVELATWPVPEVSICFNDHLYRGNRSTKMSIGDFDAFASPNFPPLAEIGIDIKLNSHLNPPVENIACDTRFSDQIYVIKLHPNLRSSYLNSIDFSTVRAVIIEAFGSGNMPMKGDYNMLPFIEKARSSGGHVIITSQAAYDSVDLSLYTSGKAAKKLGALSAGEMTMEATITKTMHILGQELAEEDFNSQFINNLAGER